jgi:hypothetical protein
MKCLFEPAIILLCVASTLASDQDRALRFVKKKAGETSQALVKGDYDRVVDLTYPVIVEKLGGRTKMIRLLKSGREEMKSKGFDFRSVTVQAPAALIQSEPDVFAIVHTSVEMSVPRGKLTQKSFLIGISADKGKSWTFIDGVNLDAKKIKQILPRFPENTKLPDKQKPIFEEGK